MRRAESAEDRLDVLRIAHSAARDYGDPGRFDAYAALRLATPLRTEAGWWLGESDGVSATSLLCYDLRFGYRGAVIEGYGFGAVATHRDQRRRGHASELCRQVAANAEARGKRIGALFSAIPPLMYERLGFRIAPGVGSRCSELRALADSGAQAVLTPLEARHELRRLRAWYDGFHANGLHFFRDSQAWQRTLEHRPSDRFFALGDRGYVRIADDDRELDLAELVVPEADVAPVLRWAARLALDLGRARLVGWWAAPSELAGLVEDVGRAKTLPMLRGSVELGGFRVWGSEYF
ncbi:MAG: GNAT family N-acetyltransferase [Myxococcota bacterium]|nr:GNAT family N-acetyltransferase [Myxococcota bacterium]